MEKQAYIRTFAAVLLALMGLSSVAQASSDPTPFQLKVPPSWKSVHDLFGIPLTLFGPITDGARPVVSVTATGSKEWGFDDTALRKTYDEYKQGREAWLKKVGGYSISYEPYQAKALSSGVMAHIVGYRYLLGTRKYFETSYYITCKENLFHLKALIPEGSNSSQAAIEEMIRSFGCS